MNRPGLVFGSVCSGVEAASLAWGPLGWRAAWVSEIEGFPSAVLAERWPDVPNLGDMTAANFVERTRKHETIDVLVGGTPCQSFSVAGARAGLDDPRGNLALVYARLARELQPRWLVWENVPGVLSSGGGRDFGSVLGALAKCGYGLAFRVLDAQHFGIPQRRRRVFVVGCLGDWRRSAAVLFEPESLSGNPPPGREEGARVAALTACGVGTCGADDNQGQAGHLIPQAFAQNSRSEVRYVGGDGSVVGALAAQPGAQQQTYVSHTLRGEGFDASEDGTGRGTPLVADPILANEGSTYCHAGNNPRVRNVVGAEAGAVRRLTPRECERLQGMPDDFTRIAWRGKAPEDCPDGPRYKAIGNSMAVPVMRWIGERIALVDGLDA